MYMYVCMYLFIRSNRTFVYLRMTAELVDYLVVSETEESAMALYLPTGCLNP